MPKSRFKQQNDFAIFFQPKRMLRNDTLVILSNDNGALRRSGDFKWPLRGTKHTVWERGTRGGCICPWKITATERREKQRTVTDWYPTLISLAGED